MELIPLSIDGGLAMTPRGDFRVSTALKDELVCIVQTANGQQMMTPDQLAKQFGWTNHSDELVLPAQ